MPTTTQELLTIALSTFSSTSIQPNTTSIIDIEKSCSDYYQNNTGFIIKEYEGIPENLVINLCVWLALIVLFTFLRRIGNYGRFGLIKNDEEKWKSNFFNPKPEDGFVSLSDTEQPQNSTINSISNDQDSLSSTSNIQSTQSSKDSIINIERSTSSLSQECPYSTEYQDKYFFSWMIHMYTLKDQHIKEKSGKDALYYLIFQRYLIVYLLIVTCLALAILLPINLLNGSATSSNKIFSRTTISNISPDDPILWVHLVLSWVFLVLGFVFVKIFSKRMEYSEGDYVSRTVLVTNYPSSFCKVDLVKQHFAEAYPDLVITDIQFAYNVSKLAKLHSKKRSMEYGRISSQKIFEKTNQRPMMHPFHFGSLFELFCCFCARCLKDHNKKVTDSIEFYTKNENELKVKIAEYKEKILKKPFGIFFITFEDQTMAAKFLKDYHLGLLGGFLRSTFNDKNRCVNCYICKNLAKTSSLSKELNSDIWSVKYATSPNNIIWENISKYSKYYWWMRVFLINIVLIVLMIFFTTPAILIEKITSWNTFINIKELESILPDYLVQFLPSLILRLLAALLPVLVALTALTELHWTRSSLNRSMMVKTFVLLLFMILILPTLGLTSINAIFQWFVDDKNIKWRCVSDNGAFFIKYVTTFSLIGTALDLLRLPDLFLYLLRMLWSRSPAEQQDVRMQVAFEFNYGVEYAWILTMFTVTLSFSVVCPLIAPFGLIYMILKHLVDRYNLYFGYISTKVDKRIHKTAVTFAIGSFIMLQFCILFFIAVRNKGNMNSNSMTTVQILVITFSCILFFGRLFFGFFKRLSPFHKYSGSSCQINNTQLENESPNISNEFEHDDSFNQIDKKPKTQQPLSASSSLNIDKQSKKKKHRKLFAKYKTKYEFQSPFVPVLLRKSTGEHGVKLISMNSTNDSDLNSSSTNFKGFVEARTDTTTAINSLNEIELVHETQTRKTFNLSKIATSNSYGALKEQNDEEVNETGSANSAYNDEA